MNVDSGIERIERELRAQITSVWLVEGAAELRPEDDLLRSGLIDSMAVMELVSFMEDTFDISVDDVEVVPNNFFSLNAMTRYVARKKRMPLDDGGGERVVADFRGLVAGSVPPGAVVLVASHGDEDLVELGERTGWHFPRDPSGCYAGYNPADGREAIDHVQALRARGATHVAFPSTELWWLDHYGELREHLESSGAVARNGAGVVYRLV